MTQNTFLIGALSGAQVNAMQGGKMKGAENYRLHITPEMISERQQKIDEQKVELAKHLKDTLDRHPRIQRLHELKPEVPTAHLLKAAHEIDTEQDDSLILDLARIYGVDVGTDTSGLTA